MQPLANYYEELDLSQKPEFTKECVDFGNCCIDDFRFIAITDEVGLEDPDDPDGDSDIDGILGLGP